MGKIKSFLRKLISCCSLTNKILFSFAFLSLILEAVFALSPEFSNFFNRYPSAFIRMIFAKLTGWFPFSLAETIIILMPVFLTLIIVYIFKTSKKSLREMVKLFLSLVSVLAFLLSSFTLSFAAGYSTTSISQKLGIKKSDVSLNDLINTSNIVKDELEALIPKIEFKKGSSSVMPYSFDEMNEHLQEAFAKASLKYSFLPSFKSKIKPIILSVPLTYTHISGIYTYFTGEANINTNYPDYILPYTAAHELSHQRGIAKEDEANFMAFLVCLESEDAYIKYSAYMNIYEYLLTALYSADPNEYYNQIKSTDEKLKYEIIAYSEFFAKYRNSIAADISGAVNDTYLAIQGQKEGQKSYGMVVDLAVAYYKQTAPLYFN